MLKPYQLIKNIKSLETSPRFLGNFYSTDEVKRFINLYEESLEEKDSNPYRLDDLDARNNDVTSIPQASLKDQVIRLLRSKIDPIINPDTKLELEYDIAFHGNKKAYGIHTDSGYDDSEFIYKQGIIPLKVDPKDKVTHTVLLNQKCYHSSSFPLISEDIEAQKQVEGLMLDHIIPDHVYRKYWNNTDERKKQMKGFSINYPFSWVIGDTIIWDRAHIHCSSDFEATGVEFKLGLMWISRVVSI